MATSSKKHRNVGISKPIPNAGYVVPHRNPALRAWAAGVACHKDAPRPVGGKLSVSVLHDIFYVRDEVARIKAEHAKRAEQSARDKAAYQEKKTR